jgi:hypothetical protein
MWWAMERRHAYMVLEDWAVYYTYKRLCKFWCASDEQYIPTLLGKPAIYHQYISPQSLLIDLVSVLTLRRMS